MLAQNFKTAADLGITDAEFGALAKVLGMLERGELPHVDRGNRRPLEFLMSTPYVKTECGTTACIGGHVAMLMGKKKKKEIHNYVNRYQIVGTLSPLYWPRTSNLRLRRLSNITDAHAAIALRNYLTHGEPRWDEAMAGACAEHEVSQILELEAMR